MRKEVERAFQDGGAAVGPPLPPEEEEVEESTEIEQPTMSVSASDPGVSGLREMVRMNRDDALARLRAGQDAIAGRRAERQKEDERAKWLALAQGMLAPTQTGSFGESLGTSAGLLRQEQQLRRAGEDEAIEMEMALAEQERLIEQDYIDQMTAFESGQLAEKPVGVMDLFPHPEEPGVFAHGQQFYSPETGQSEIRYVRDEFGNIPRAIDTLDAQVRAQIEFEKARAAGQVTRIDADIEDGRKAYSQASKLNRALDLLDGLESRGATTSGVMDLMTRFGEFFGSTDENVRDLGALRMYLGEQVLAVLESFPGQLSNMELQYAQRLREGIQRAGVVNRALLEEGSRILRAKHRRGVMAAWEIRSDFDLRAMGVDPETFGGTYDENILRRERVGQTDERGRPVGPGSSASNPLDYKPGDPRPPRGTYVKLPDGRTVQYMGGGSQ